MNAPNFDALADEAAAEPWNETGCLVKDAIAECWDNNPEPDDNEGRIGTLVSMLSEHHCDQAVRDWFTARGVRY